MTKLTKEELIGAELILIEGYIEQDEHADYIFLKLKDGSVVRVGGTTWETLWIARDGGF